MVFSNHSQQLMLSTKVNFDGKPCSDDLPNLSDDYPNQSTLELTKDFCLNHSTIVTYLQNKGKFQKARKWILHEFFFFFSFTESYKEWVHYNNLMCWKSWVNPKQAAIANSGENVFGDMWKACCIMAWWNCYCKV